MSVAWVPRIGSEFAGYRLEGLIGHGGMSIVYRAQHLKLERTVALKLLMPELSEDESFRERFTRESRLAAALDHPNVIPVYEAGDIDGVFYIAMRFVDGSNLKSLLETDGPLGPARAASIVSQAASALHAAHEQKGLVHRDVKPANILVVPGDGPDEPDHVYLSDFGIAKQRSMGALTKTGMFVGTAEYAAPEQIEGKELDRRADIYSMGCVLYECLTGSPAYEKDSEVALMYAHLLEPPPSITAARPDLSPEIDRVLERAMAKSRDDRFETAREFAGAVRKALIGTETGTRTSPQADDQPPVPVGETVLSAATAATPGPPTAPPAQPPAAPPSPAGAPPPAGPGFGRRGKLAAAALGALAVVGGIVAAIILVTGGGKTKTALVGSFLDLLVPSEVAKDCTTLNKPLVTSIATIKCTPPANAPASFPKQLEFLFFKNGTDAKNVYVGTVPAEKWPPGAGKCDSIRWLGNGEWHHAATGKLGGDRACFFANGKATVPGVTLTSGAATMEWTHLRLVSTDHVDMVAIASDPGRGSQATLYGWYRPYHEIIGKCRPSIPTDTCSKSIDHLLAAAKSK